MKADSKLTPTQLTFIERFCAINATLAIPHSTLRVLAYLVICSKAEQTADEIIAALSLSAGSVSVALNILTEAQFVSRIKNKGERRPYYCLNSDSWERAVKLRIKAINDMALFSSQVYLEQNSYTNERLKAMRDTYAYFAAHLEGILDK